MSYKEVKGLDCDETIALGGKNKDGRPNPKKIEGYYLGSKQVANAMSKTGLSWVHIFETAAGNIGVWGKANLDNKLKTATKGLMTLVTHEGFAKAKPGRKPMYLFKVLQDDDNAVEVSEEQAQDAVDTGSNESDSYQSDTSDEYMEDIDVSADAAPVDEAPYSRAKPPTRPASKPDAEKQAEVQRLLRGARKSA